MPAYEYQRLRLPRTTSRDAARELMTVHALYGEWELARVRLYPDGTRHVTMRRPRRPGRRPLGRE